MADLLLPDQAAMAEVLLRLPAMAQAVRQRAVLGEMRRSLPAMVEWPRPEPVAMAAMPSRLPEMVPQALLPAATAATLEPSRAMPAPEPRAVQEVRRA